MRTHCQNLARGMAYNLFRHRAQEEFLNACDPARLKSTREPPFCTRKFLQQAICSLKNVEYRETTETTTAEFPFLLNTGRTLYQFNAGTMTSRTRNRDFRPEDLLDISPSDARKLRLRDGERVQLRSRYGSARLPIRISEVVRSGEVFATFHTPEVFLNLVTSSERDGITGTPEYKRTSVRIEKIS